MSGREWEEEEKAIQSERQPLNVCRQNRELKKRNTWRKQKQNCHPGILSWSSACGLDYFLPFLLQSHIIDSDDKNNQQQKSIPSMHVCDCRISVAAQTLKHLLAERR